MLGVNASTLRQWTSAGKVHVYRTPGGHRRYSTAELAQLSRADGASQERAAVQDIMAQLRSKYRNVAHSPSSRSPWLQRLSDEARGRFHNLGDDLLAQLQTYLSADTPRSRQRALARAREIAAQYGRVAREVGLATQEAVDAYLLFRRPLLELLARSLAVHPELGGELSPIIRDSERFMDEVLAVLAGARSAQPELQRAN
jgi:DNA-binding transcriptional MerR regulator